MPEMDGYAACAGPARDADRRLRAGADADRPGRPRLDQPRLRGRRHRLHQQADQLGHSRPSCPLHPARQPGLQRPGEESGEARERTAHRPSRQLGMGPARATRSTGPTRPIASSGLTPGAVAPRFATVPRARASGRPAGAPGGDASPAADRRVRRPRRAHAVARRPAASRPAAVASALATRPARSLRLSGTIQDVTELKEAEQRIRYLAYYDGITGLPNRQFFMERLQQALGPCPALPSSARCAVAGSRPVQAHQRHARPHGRQRAAVLGVAAALGCRAGSDLIQSRRRSPEFRAEPSRPSRGLDGDEFSLLITELTHYHDAAKVARRLLEELRKPFRVGQPGSLRVGQRRPGSVPARRRRRRDPDQERRCGDALRQGSGARQLSVLQPRDERHRAGEAVAWNRSCARRSSATNCCCYYQPKIRTPTGRDRRRGGAHSLEASGAGLVPPAQFIPAGRGDRAHRPDRRLGSA